ncbi:MAG: hypothetical protein ACOQNV_01275 [Mycoplasmoidaceae bacterium]
MQKKNWLIFLPNLLGITGLSTISLAACNNGSKPVEKPSFTVTASTMETDNIHAPIELDWTPSDHSLTFSSFSFTFNNGSESATEVYQQGKDGDRPLSLYINFGKEVENDIVDGTLSFRYIDSTTSSKGQATVRDIRINKVPEIHFNFSVPESQMSSAKEASINLNWTPGNTLTFYGFEFKYGSEPKSAVVSTQSSSAGTQVLKLAFDEEITISDITDGILSFQYKDNLSSQIGSGVVNNIKISKFEQEINFNFSVIHSQMLDKQTTNINLNWTPNNRTLSFENPTFKYDGAQKSAVVSTQSSSAGTQVLKLDFNEEITISDITDGILSFHYKDTVSLQEGDASVTNIYISKYEETDIQFEFSVEESEMISETQANINLSWTPSNVPLILSDIVFKYGSEQKTAEISRVSAEEGLQTFSLSFGEDITESDITDGVLSFHYRDDADEYENDWFVDDIIIKKFVPQTQFDFSVPNSRMSELRSASINLNWTPSSRSLDLSNFSFTYAGGSKEASVGSVSTNGVGSQTLSLLFDQDIIATDIDDGVLSFHYSDPVSAQEDDVTIDNIYIFKYVEEIEFDFSVKSEGMASKRSTSIDLKWMPNDQTLTLSEPRFKYGKQSKEASVTLASGEPGSQTLDLVFSEDIDKEDINDGELSFHYKDEATSQEGDITVDGIHIRSYVSTFEDDSWENVSRYASQGLNVLKDHYQVDSFVGKTKDIIVDGYTYQLQVIGENEDYRANDDGSASNIPVALTFMFKTAIQEYDSETSSYQPYLVDFSNEEYYWEDDLWQFSIPKQYLQNTFLPKLKTVLGDDVIKKVSKNTINALPTGNVVASGEELFLPSLADFFSSEEGTFQLPEVSPGVANQNAYIQEGRKYIQEGTEHYARYSYFEKTVSEDYSHLHPELCVYDGSGEGSQGISYWLRSSYPTIDPDDGRAEWIYYYGEDAAQKGMFWTAPTMSDPILTPVSFALAPIFCI